MEKQPNFRPIKRLKEKTKEQRQKIKGAVIKRKDDFLTALEKNWRDAALKPLTSILWKLGITANLLTSGSFLLLFWGIYSYFNGGSLTTHLIILLIVALADGVDGPLARNNQNVTVLGTWMDHTRDYSLVAWATYLILKFQLINAQLIIVLWVLELILVWVLLKDFLIKYLKGLKAEEESVLITKFSLDNLQASLIGRLQFFSWAMAYGFLLGSLVLPMPFAGLIGQTFITLAIIFSAINISDSYQKTLPDYKSTKE